VHQIFSITILKLAEYSKLGQWAIYMWFDCLKKRLISGEILTSPDLYLGCVRYIKKVEKFD